MPSDEPSKKSSSAKETEAVKVPDKDKELLSKMKTPPKAADISSIVKKYTIQQSEILKKDLLASQASFSKELKDKMLGLTQIVTSLATNMVTPVTQLQTAAQSQILPTSPPHLNESFEEDEIESQKGDDEDLDDDDNETLVDGVESKRFKKRVKPAGETVRLWTQARKVTDDYNAEDWKKTISNPVVQQYTSHPGAKSFKAPAVDSEVPQLKYKEQKEFEKKV